MKTYQSFLQEATQSPEDKKKEQEAKRQKEKASRDRFDKNRSGFGAGVKKALGGDTIGMRKKKGDEEYNDLVDKQNREKKKEAVKGAVGTARRAVRGVLSTPTNKEVDTYHATPIA